MMNHVNNMEFNILIYSWGKSKLPPVYETRTIVCQILALTAEHYHHFINMSTTMNTCAIQAVEGTKYYLYTPG